MSSNLSYEQIITQALNTNYDIYERFDFIEEIGFGTTSVVFKVQDRFTGAFYCCKVLPRESEGEVFYLDNLASEVYALKSLYHPNIPQFVDFFMDYKNYYIVQEYCYGKSLFEFINSTISIFINFEIDTIKQILRQIFNALSYLQVHGIAHRDIKPENIIIDDRDLKCLRVKIIDFGYSTINDSQLQTAVCGSVFYIAPEILKQVPYTASRADIWSVGVIMYIMLTGKMPFEGETFDEVSQQIIAGRYSLPSSVSQEAAQLLSKILVVDPSKRISAAEALKEDFLFITSTCPLSKSQNYNTIHSIIPRFSMSQVELEKKENPQFQPALVKANRSQGEIPRYPVKTRPLYSKPRLSAGSKRRNIPKGNYANQKIVKPAKIIPILSCGK